MHFLRGVHGIDDGNLSEVRRGTGPASKAGKKSAFTVASRSGAFQAARFNATVEGRHKKRLRQSLGDLEIAAPWGARCADA
jgi:hypothetical protein